MKKMTLLLISIAFSPLSLASSQQPQEMDHSAHAGHDMGSDPKAWRMPPMDFPMPMLPGMAGATPIVGPFLARMDADDLTVFEEAVPGEIVEMKDGETLQLEASIVRRTLAGKTFLMYGYNGQYPGPLIKADRGATVTVEFTNAIEMPTTVHWHGLRLDNRFDGVPDVTQAPVRPGESFTYQVHFPDSGIYWYHPHMREDIQQDLGLYGNMLVDPPEEDYYNPVNREAVLILDDLLIDDLGLIPWGDRAPTHALMGRFGNLMLLNGVPDYRLSVQRGEVVRFYLTNVANSRTFNVVFGDAKVKVVASDVSKFEREEWVDSVVIAPAERYIVEVLFQKSGEQRIVNSIQAINDFMGEFFPHTDLLGTIEVEEGEVSDVYSAEFESLRRNRDVEADLVKYRPYFDKPVDRRLELTLEIENLPIPIVRAMEFEAGLYAPPVEWNDAMPMMNWLASAEQVHWNLLDPDTDRQNMDIDWQFEQGDIVKIRVFNDPQTIHPMNHPFHIHGQRFLVLSIDETANRNLVWKDTTIIPVGSTVDLLVDMTNPGKWMAHCHIAEHLHAGMMMSFEVLPQATGN